jgi:hypothetical protein
LFHLFVEDVVVVTLQSGENFTGFFLETDAIIATRCVGDERQDKKRRLAGM